ncbi:hypothetical protein RhiJN_09761 [Ceratobasidium sp. AG-Ba]|nr:hypothetical protein RhiJN_09761 [Ceratobasidium sp. AG-Ba]QRW10518.1 hypothetical protein RhiLY_09517 [Ceratobasidium sp. AG-Ba]
MSVWNTSESISATGVRDQERVEYDGQSFSDCFVNNTRFDYSLAEQTQTVTVGVVCPGTNQSYPIFVSMETELVFAQMLSKDFIGQYYGPGLKLMNITHESGSNYQKIVLGALEVISTDSLTIMRNYNTSSPPMSASIIYYVDPNKGTAKYETSTFTHLDGTVELWPTPARVYTNSIENLIYVANHAVNLDLGSTRSPNLFRDVLVVPKAILPNPMPPNTSSNQWVGNDSISFYYGALPAGYDSWADALLDGKPFKLGDVTDLPPDSTMVTTYLCSTYQVKPTGALASSVITGILSMGNTAWGIWLIVLALLVTKYQAPVVECLCNDCIKKAEDAFRKRKMGESGGPEKMHPSEEVQAAGNPDSATVINRLLTLEDKIRDLESRLRDSPPGDGKAEFIRFPMEQRDSQGSAFSGGANK